MGGHALCHAPPALRRCLNQTGPDMLLLVLCLQGERVWTAMRYDMRGSTEVRSRLRLRSTVPGANNRLDIQVGWLGLWS